MQKRTKGRILVVEDKYLLALLAEQELASAGYEVLGPVGTQEEAVRLAVQEQPDLVLMDVRLANGDGIAAATEILARTGVRCVFVTAETDRSAASRARPLGWINKPYAPSELLAAISTAISHSRPWRGFGQAVFMEKA